MMTLRSRAVPCAQLTDGPPGRPTSICLFSLDLHTPDTDGERQCGALGAGPNTGVVRGEISTAACQPRAAIKRFTGAGQLEILISVVYQVVEGDPSRLASSGVRERGHASESDVNYDPLLEFPSPDTLICLHGHRPPAERRPAARAAQRTPPPRLHTCLWSTPVNSQ